MKKSNTIFQFIFAALVVITNVANAQKLESEFLYKINLQLEAGIDIGKTPIGTRVLYQVKGGTFEGPKLKGKVRPVGGDWVLRLDSVTTKLNVRILLETDDAQLITCTYNGIVHNNPDGTTYWRMTPLFETSSKKYDWVNYIIAVGKGSFGDGGVAYDVFAIK